ncbi:YcxB family protein [Lacticaseibacillus hulanensis]|uniref:YcxB family protein n=1 Tax=Lacticaseibacillus hulanensis TaxID=2493111 RepID=UPI000FD9C9BD|nr:YcxB family protein [Lacticaseibacillus hulanensis]
MELHDLSIDQQDYFNYLQWFQKHGKIRLLQLGLVIGGVILIAYSCLLGVTGSYVWGTLAPIIFLGVFAIVYLPLLTRWRAVTAYRSPKNAAVFAPATFVIDDTGVTATAANGSGHRDWTGFLEAAETPSLFILMSTSRQGQLLPKSGMTEEQIQELRAIISRNMTVDKVKLG